MAIYGQCQKEKANPSEVEPISMTIDGGGQLVAANFAITRICIWSQITTANGYQHFILLINVTLPPSHAFQASPI